MNTKAPKAPSARTMKARENQKKRLEHVREVIKRANAGEIMARYEIIMILSKAFSYHDSGKIEGLTSLDTACANNDFCHLMQESDAPEMICKYCYTRSFWETATAAHYITGLILSEVTLTEEEAAAVAVPALMIRFNCDGELINQIHAANLLRIAKTHPVPTFTIWTKRPGILNAVIKTYGKPANLVCGISSPMINVPFRDVFTWCDFVFTVYTPRGMEEALARGEFPCNGRKCMECRFRCYQRHDASNGPVFIAEALRRPKGVSAKAFPAVIAAIDAATLDK